MPEVIPRNRTCSTIDELVDQACERLDTQGFFKVQTTVKSHSPHNATLMTRSYFARDRLFSPRFIVDTPEEMTLQVKPPSSHYLSGGMRDLRRIAY